MRILLRWSQHDSESIDVESDDGAVEICQVNAAKLGPADTEAAAALDAARHEAYEAGREDRKAKHAVIEAKGRFKSSQAERE